MSTPRSAALRSRSTRAGFDRVIGTSGTILSLGAVAVRGRRTHAPSAPLRNRRIPAEADPPHPQGSVALRSREAPARPRPRAAARRPRRRRRDPARRAAARGSAPRRSRSATCRCAKGSCSTTSRATARRSRRPIAIPTSGAAACSSSPTAATTGRSTRSTSRACRSRLFDQTRAIHGLTDREREWLEYAAILHDIGVLISYEGHHKHSYYLVKNGDLRGFEPEEIETIALVARYHRQATPKREHDGFSDLPRRTRRDRPHAGRDPAPRGEPRPQPRAERSPASSSTTAATTTCCSCARRATPSWSSGPRRATPRRSNA